MFEAIQHFNSNASSVLFEKNNSFRDKIEQTYLEKHNHKIFFLIDYNNLCYFKNIKSLISYQQIQWSYK